MTNTWQDIKNANVVVVMGGNALVMAADGLRDAIRNAAAMRFKSATTGALTATRSSWCAE